MFPKVFFLCSIYLFWETIKSNKAKGLVVELTSPHTQSVWGFREERVRTARLAAYCNYFSKKKKKKIQ